MKLYELTDSYFELLNLLEQEVDNDHIKEALVVIDDEFDVKAENLVKVIRSLEASAEALKTEKIRLQDRQRAVENNVKNLKEYLQFNMETLGKDKVRTELFSLNIQNNPPRLVVDDEKEIPKAYWEEQPAKLNKKMLLEDLKSSNNTDFKGAHIEQGKGLRIR